MPTPTDRRHPGGPTQPTTHPDRSHLGCPSPLDTIRDALRQARRFALSHRYGGTGQLYSNLQLALDALSELEKRSQPQQLTLEEARQ